MERMSKGKSISFPRLMPSFCNYTRRAQTVMGLRFVHPGEGDIPTPRPTEGRGIMSRAGRWPYVRKLAWDRDRKARAVCHICGQPIRYDLKPSSDPDAWEPDHVLPVSKNPELELDLKNIKPSHMRCNRARGDNSYNFVDIGMQSRVW